MIEWEAEATDAVGHDEANCARTRQDEREWHAALALLLLLDRNLHRQEALAERRRAVHGRKIDIQTRERPSERDTCWTSAV